jgi:hypothetical protein
MAAAIPTAYRRRRDDPIWHWCRGCSNWPDYLSSEESTEPPDDIQLCSECRERQRSQSCHSNPM